MAHRNASLILLSNPRFSHGSLTDWLAWGERMREAQHRNPPAVAEKLRKARAERDKLTSLTPAAEETPKEVAGIF